MLIQKYLAEQGICSRREGEKLVREGGVLVNGIVATNGQIVQSEKDVVTLSKLSTVQKVTIAVHKPRGIVCSRNTAEGTTIFELLPHFAHLHVVGRLDKESEGLLLLTNDGLITRKVTGADHTVEKEYVVVVRERIFPGMMQRMRSGIVIDGQKTLPCTATVLDAGRTYIENTHAPNAFCITLKEGRKHQIRRMCEACKLTVVSLTRVRIGSVELGELGVGKYEAVTKKMF
jgi:23S rRNA pseudouridine2604 synthase